MELEIQELLHKGYACLLQNDHVTAAKYYNRLIVLRPDQPIGYVGQALALLIRPNSCSNVELAEAVLKCKGLQCDPEFLRDLKKLVDLRITQAEAPLLAFACNNYNYEMAKILVNFGAEINIKCGHDVTPLWFTCRKEIPNQHKADGRRIAQLLLDRGAAINVVNDGGIALYSQRTDPQIAEMIRQHYPDVVRGDAASSGRSASDNKISMSVVLSISGLVIGIILGTVFDKFLVSFLWAGALAAVGALLGIQIDRIRSGEKSVLGKAVRNILIALVTLAIFGVLLGNCVNNDQEFGYCPNCHSRVDTKYIKNGQCNRCDGNDWYD